VASIKSVLTKESGVRGKRGEDDHKFILRVLKWYGDLPDAELGEISDEVYEYCEAAQQAKNDGHDLPPLDPEAVPVDEDEPGVNGAALGEEDDEDSGDADEELEDEELEDEESEDEDEEEEDGEEEIDPDEAAEIEAEERRAEAAAKKKRAAAAAKKKKEEAAAAKKKDAKTSSRGRGRPKGYTERTRKFRLLHIMNYGKTGHEMHELAQEEGIDLSMSSVQATMYHTRATVDVLDETYGLGISEHLMNEYESSQEEEKETKPQRRGARAHTSAKRKTSTRKATRTRTK
jgi:hypothetical protein